MALGRPVVTTSLGCEGLTVVDGRDVLVANTPTLFVDRVVQLLTDATLRSRLRVAARQLVEAHYDWATIGQRLANVYAELVRPAM